MRKQDVGILITLCLSAILPGKAIALTPQPTIPSSNDDHLQPPQPTDPNPEETYLTPRSSNINSFTPQTILVNQNINLNPTSTYHFPDANHSPSAIFAEPQTWAGFYPPIVNFNFPTPSAKNPNQTTTTPKTNPQLLLVQNREQRQSQLPPEQDDPRLPVPIVPEELPPLPIPEAPPPEPAPTPPTPPTPEENRQLTTALVRNLLESSASRYPYLVNTSDQLAINPRNFQPAKFSFYSNINFNLGKIPKDDTRRDSFIQSANISLYPQEKQLYWVLDNNRVVIETQGNHFHVSYQGSATHQTTTQTVKVSTTFTGTQLAVAIPIDFKKLVGVNKLEEVNFTVGVAQITLPPGTNPVNTPEFNLNIIRPNGTVTQERYLIDAVKTATTYEPLGGGSFFENLKFDNAPQFLQGFPTVNLSPLLNNGVTLEPGSIIPRENLIAAGITPADILTGQGFSFQPQLTSKPGVKDLRLGRTDNDSLVALLSNPFLTQQEKDVYYLNSLMWNNLGQSRPQVTTSTQSHGSEYWSRYTLTSSHNRTLIDYDPEKIQLNYTNVFSNPGLSLTSDEWNNTDLNQSVNSTIGLVSGSLFSLINPHNLNQSLEEAKNRYQNLQPLGSLNTKATSGERRQMNQRLNSTLSYADSNTNLSQVSGSYTFTGNVTPNSSLLSQLRTGLYKRRVQFTGQIVNDWSPEQKFVIESVTPSTLNPIAYIGINISPRNVGNTNNTNNINNNTNTNTNNNRTIGVSFIQAENSNGDNLFNQFEVFDSSEILTAVPIPGGGKAFARGSGRMVLSTAQDRTIETYSYIGDVYLPTMELLMAGSVDKINYALAAGMWFNPSPDSAPMVSGNLTNSNGIKETSMGGTFKFSAKTDFTSVAYDQNNQWRRIISSSPFINFNYNTNANILNLSTISVGNVFQYNRRDFNLVFYPVLSFSPPILNPGVNNDNLGTPVGFASLNFSHKSSLNINASVSVTEETIYRMEATYNVFSNPQSGTLTMGASYVNSPNNRYGNIARNIRSITLPDSDIQFRSSYLGMIVRYQSPNSKIAIDSRIQNSESGWRGQLNLQVKL